MSRTEHLVTAAALETELAGSSPPLVLDVRWHLTDAPGAGRARYAAAHLPNARFLDLEQVLTRHTGQARDGRHPLPTLEGLASGLAAVGVGADSEVVVYDEARSFAAARAWWVLRWAGIRARVLDGGIDAWQSSGRAMVSGAPAVADPAGAPVPLLTGGHLHALSIDEAAAWPEHGVLVDVRAGERYRGETEPLDPRAGHIPGAVNALQAGGLFAPGGGLPTDDELRVAAAGLAVAAADGELAAYCGSGVSAAHSVLALAVIDVPAALFPGSWSAWSNDPARPVATGPGGD